MSGRGRGKKVEAKTPGETPGAKGLTNAEKRKESLEIKAPAEEKKKAKPKLAAQPRGARPPAREEDALPHTPEKGEEDKKVPRNKPKRGDRPDAQPRGARSPASCSPLQKDALPHTPEKGEEDKVEVPRNLPKRGGRNDADPARVLQNTLDKLRIKRNQRIEAAKCVNEIQDAVKKHVEKSLDWCKDIRVLKTGSYYEDVKICESDEFDMILAVSVDRVDIQPFGEDGAFYSIAMKRHPKHPLHKFLNEDKTIRAWEMLSEFREKVKEAVAKRSDVTVENKKPGCPAVTLLVKKEDTLISLDFVLGIEVHSSSWPIFTKDGFKIENWLGKKNKYDLKRKPYYLVPKYEGKGLKEHEGVLAKDAWRISFSHVEKEILKQHGHSKTCCQDRAMCCRKPCLKLMKYLFQKLKEKHPTEVKKLCSYHAKTTLLHACAARVEDHKWAADQLVHCFQQLLLDFEENLKKYHLPNFFIPTHNLLKSAGLDKKSCNALADFIEYERNNGFPLFR